MSLVNSLIAFVDRDVGRWNGTPLASFGIACVPLLIWALAVGVPANAEPIYISAMIAFAGLWLALGSWRSAVFKWRELKRIQALGAAELAEMKRNG